MRLDVLEQVWHVNSVEVLLSIIDFLVANGNGDLPPEDPSDPSYSLHFLGGRTDCRIYLEQWCRDGILILLQSQPTSQRIEFSNTSDAFNRYFRDWEFSALDDSPVLFFELNSSSIFSTESTLEPTYNWCCNFYK